MSTITAGSPAPAFDLHDHAAQPFDSAGLAGEAHALWFYPRASTPG